jgi:hypothetical protein
VSLPWTRTPARPSEKILLLLSCPVLMMIAGVGRVELLRLCLQTLLRNESVESFAT